MLPDGCRDVHDLRRFGLESPTDFCGTSSGVADTPLAAKVTAGEKVTYSTNDNRAFQPPDAAAPNGAGGLVDMTVPVGEPDSVGAIDNGLVRVHRFPDLHRRSRRQAGELLRASSRPRSTR